jgi:hypothetical protein
MKIEYSLIHFLALFAILLLLWPVLQSSLLTLRPRQDPRGCKPKIPRPLKPKTADDCPLCRAEQESPHAKPGDRPTPPPWHDIRSRRGRKKTISTQGYACNDPNCIYYHIMDEDIHALVGYGSHGKHEKIQDLMCQACKKKFSVRRDTVLYRLKTHSEKAAHALALLAEGVDGGNPRVTMEATTKVIPVFKLGPRSLDMAMGVIHELFQRMQADCWPIFSSDGLKLYFYALTTHVGCWVLPDGAHKPLWKIATNFLYAQVKNFIAADVW